ncbi:MAG: hypothetical protein H6728_09315 [Myxococcales bacterium]|nr:hypothetical protein [Myxococcales bacterium]MCB9643263.1 hypothetical protein [Myxococcales bacterium]
MLPLRRFSGWTATLGVLFVTTLAWTIAPTAVKSRPVRFHNIFFQRLHNMTPSAAWSPDSRYLAFHSLRATPTYAAPHLHRYRRSTRSRYYRRSTRSRYYRRSTRSRVYVRSTRSRVYVRSTRSRVYVRSTRSRHYRRSTHTYVHRRSTRSRYYRRSTRSRYRANLYAERIYTTGSRSQLGLVDIFRRRMTTLSYRTHRTSTLSIAYFRPRWVNRTVVTTSTGFSGDAQLIDVTTRAHRSLRRFAMTSSHPTDNLLVGRDPQVGVFLTSRRNPNKRYALVDKRRRIGGYLPKFSPDGSMLAWIDTNHDYSAARLRVYAFPYRSETLSRDATLRVRSPWNWEKTMYAAIEMKEIQIPETGPVVDFVWGTKGRRIAYVRGNGYSGAGNYKHTSKGLFLLQLDSDKPRARLLDPIGDQPSFLSSGSLAYHRHNQTRDEIWFWNAGRGGKTFVTFGHEPRVSPNGRYLAYLRWLPPQMAWSSRAQLFLGVVALP